MFYFVPHNAMTDSVFETSQALLNAIDVHLPDNTWIEVTATLAPELEQLGKAVEIEKQCRKAVESVSADFGG